MGGPGGGFWRPWRAVFGPPGGPLGAWNTRAWGAPGGPFWGGQGTGNGRVFGPPGGAPRRGVPGGAKIRKFPHFRWVLNNSPIRDILKSLFWDTFAPQIRVGPGAPSGNPLPWGVSGEPPSGWRGVGGWRTPGGPSLRGPCHQLSTGNVASRRLGRWPGETISPSEQWRTSAEPPAQQSPQRRAGEAVTVGGQGDATRVVARVHPAQRGHSSQRRRAPAADRAASCQSVGRRYPKGASVGLSDGGHRADDPTSSGESRD